MRECQKEMMIAGKAYPRTCPTCGLGPCKKGHPSSYVPAAPPTPSDAQPVAWWCWVISTPYPSDSCDTPYPIFSRDPKPGCAPVYPQSALDAERQKREAAERERDEARQIVRDIFWMALRYADGRMTYAVGVVNDAVRKGYDGGWITPKDTGGDQVTPRFARDGTMPEWTGPVARAEAAEASLAKANARIEEMESRIERKDEALRQAILHIEGDEVAHRRTFAAGRVARAALTNTEKERDDGI